MSRHTHTHTRVCIHMHMYMADGYAVSRWLTGLTGFSPDSISFSLAGTDRTQLNAFSLSLLFHLSHIPFTYILHSSLSLSRSLTLSVTSILATRLPPAPHPAVCVVPIPVSPTRRSHRAAIPIPSQRAPTPHRHRSVHPLSPRVAFTRGRSVNWRLSYDPGSAARHHRAPHSRPYRRSLTVAAPTCACPVSTRIPLRMSSTVPRCPCSAQRRSKSLIIRCTAARCRCQWAATASSSPGASTMAAAAALMAAMLPPQPWPARWGQCNRRRRHRRHKCPVSRHPACTMPTLQWLWAEHPLRRHTPRCQTECATRIHIFYDACHMSARQRSRHMVTSATGQRIMCLANCRTRLIRPFPRTVTRPTTPWPRTRSVRSMWPHNCINAAMKLLSILLSFKLSLRSMCRTFLIGI